MPEQPVWTGTSSQVKNIKPFIVCGILVLALLIAGFFVGKITGAPRWASLAVMALAVIPIFLAVWHWLDVHARKFELTTERLLISSGILTVTTDTLELYRVKDIRTTQPPLLRIFNLENIDLITSDVSTRFTRIDHVSKSNKLPDHLRTNVEACRQLKGTREIELE